MTTYTELQAELAEAIWKQQQQESRNSNSPVSNFDRVCELLDAGVEPDAGGIARLIVFYREVSCNCMQYNWRLLAPQGNLAEIY